jgi:uncharacterized repeat protein (TIGR02543 family)
VEHGSSMNELVGYERTGFAVSDPTSVAYDFLGWYADSSFSTQFDFNDPITDNTTIYAGWSFKQFTITLVDCPFADFYQVDIATGYMLNNAGSQFSVNYGSTLYFKVAVFAEGYSNAIPYIGFIAGTMSYSNGIYIPDCLYTADSNGIYTVSITEDLPLTEDLTLFVEDMPLDIHYVILTENDYLSFTYLTDEDITFGSNFRWPYYKLSLRELRRTRYSRAG